MEVRQVLVGEVYYGITEEGFIVRRDGKGFLKLSTTNSGYLNMVVVKNGRAYNRYVHRLVYEAFVGPIPPGMTVDHIDNDRLNNHYKNLQLLSRKDNIVKALAKGYTALSPSNEVVEVYNLREFCRENSLHHGAMHSILTESNPNRKSHKGWRKHK